MSLHYVVLLLGSNLGDTELHLNNAIAKIENCLGNIIKSSEMIETPPIEFGSINIFRNIAISLTTTISPYSFLNIVKSIVKDKLNGKFKIHADESGTTCDEILFHF